MKKEIYYKSDNGSDTIYASVYECENPVMIVQVLHGMCEYVDRYEGFAEFLNSNNIILAGNNHLGHGKTAETLGFFSSENSLEHAVNDVKQLTDMLKREYNLPIVYLGHSMGSFLLRYYISEYEAEKAVIMGTGYIDDFSAMLLLLLSSVISAFKGETYRSPLLVKMTTEKYARMVHGSKHDWISYNRENIAAYVKDPYCNFDFTVNGYKTIAKCLLKINKKSTVQKTDNSMKILFISGRDDPVGNFGKGVVKVYKKYKKAGFKNLRLRLLNNMRHEILNEDNKNKVYNIILNFIEN